MLRGNGEKEKKKKGYWHPASPLFGKSKCQRAHIGNVQILEQKHSLGTER